jgi:gliding motility-associated-like protein
MKHRLLTCLLVLFSAGLFGQVITPFSIRYQATQKGGIRYISNTAVSCNGGPGCAPGRAEVPPAGTSTDNGFTAAYVDIDSDGSTFMSSSDSIALPTCSQISWAGLYWGGEITNAAANYTTRNQVRIKTNNGSYVNLTADALQDNTIGFDTYHCFKDITTIIQAGGTNSRYTVANVAVRVGNTNVFGGWTIVVVYKNDLQPMRNLTVFNGLSNVSGSNPITDITVSGFLTPLSGPVTFEVGHITHDGDRSSTGDQMMFNGGSGFVNISDAANTLNDIFNSTYSYNGVQKTTPFINPGYTNSLGFDADIFIPNNAAKNYIGNSATSATLRLTTGGETFLTQVVTMAIDVYEPDLRAACRVVDLNGGSVLPGDILEYTIVGKNIGSDPSVNTFITDTLEYNAVYVPGSLSVAYGPNSGLKTDAAGDDQAEYIAAQRVIRVRVGTGANAVSGGQMNNSPLGVDSTLIRFRAMATTDCIVLQCDNIINNRAYIFGTGNVSGNSWSNGSNPNVFDGFGCPVPGTTNTPISAASCLPPAAASNSPVCTGSTLSLTTSPSSSIATYSWTGPGGFVSTAANPNRANSTAAMAGTYTCVITVPSSACSYTVTTVVIVNVRPATPTPSSNTPVCTGNTISLNTAAVAGATYSWTGPSAFASALQNPTRPAATVAMSGTYSVTVTANGCTSAVGTTVVIVNTTPGTPSPSSNSPVCTGNSIGLSTPAVGGATYSWTGPNSYASSVQNPVITNATVAMAGTYSVTVTTNGCTSGVGTVAVVVNATPATPAASSNTPVCTGNSITLSTPAVAGATYSWTGPNSFVSAVQNPVIANATAAMTGTYSVTVTTNGCTSAFGTTAVVVNTTPATPAPGSNSPVCTGNTISLTTTAVAGATYSWTGPSSFSSALQNPTITNATVAMAGTYSLTVTTNGCTSAVGTVAVVVNATPATPTASSNTPVCTGNTISLTTPAVAGATYSWTGPSAFASALQNPTRPAATVAMAGTYSVTVTTNGCTSAVGTTAVIVNTTPATPAPSSNSPVCTGNSITLTTTAVAGATYSWTGPNSFVSSVQNPVIANATVAMAGTYSLTVTTNGCTSAFGTVAVVVNATPATPAPSSNSPVCTGNSITLTTTAVAGASYSWTGPNSYVSSVQNPVIANATVAMAGTYSLTVTTNGCTSAFGTTAVVVNATPATPTASSNTPVCTGNSITLTTTAVAGATYSWTGPNSYVSSVQNPVIANATVAMAGTYSVTVTTNGCTSAFGTTAVVVNATPATPTASSNTPVCTGNTINLFTPAVAGATYSWTGPASFASAAQNPNRTNATVAMAGTYSVTVTTNGCTSAFGTTAVVVNPTPATPAALSNSPVCTGNTINLSTAAVAGATYSWTGPSSFSSSVQNPSIINATLAMAGTYSLTVTTNGCTSAMGTVAVVVNATPATPAASSNSPVCVGSTINLSTPAVAGATYSWTGPNSYVSSVQNPVIANATAAMAGTYSVTVTTNGCTSAIGTTVVTITPPPTTATAGAPQTICVSTATMSANTPVNGTGVWSQISGPNTATITNASSPTTTMTGLITGSYVFQWTISNSPCTASSDQVLITVSGIASAANAGLDQSLCNVTMATMTGNNAAPGTGVWTQISGPNTATITTPASEATTMTGLIAGSYVFEWTITNPPCGATSDQVTISISDLPTTAVAGPAQAICATSATMAANTPATGTGLWSQVSGPNTATITTASSPTTTMTGLVAGTYVFQWTIANAPCAASADQVNVVVSDVPTTSAAGSDQTICSAAGAATMAANTPLIGTGAWTQISGPVTATITTPASEATTITGLTTAGTYVFEWTITNGSCAASTDQVSIIVNDPPTASAAGAAQSLCNVTAATMAANIAAIGTGNWTQVSGPNTATITTPASETTTMTGLIAGTYVFEWTISNAPCASSSSQVQVDIFDSPTTSAAGNDTSICTTSGATTMSANAPATGTGAWTQVNGPVTATITTPASPVTTITGLTAAGTYTFQWDISNGVCSPSTDQVQVTVFDPPTTSIAGPDQALCASTTATMAANIATTGTGAWTQVSGPNTATITTPASEATTMTGLVAGTYLFEWTISNGACSPSSDTVEVIIYDLPTASAAGNDQQLCNATSATMAANTVTTGIGAWSQASGPNTATITTPASEATTITGLVSGTYVFVWSITNGNCAPSNDSVTITIDPLPTTAAAGPDQLNACAPVTMAANVPVVGTGLWSQVSGPNTATITTPASEATTITGMTPGTYVFVWTISSGVCAASTDTVQIVIVGCDNDNDGIPDSVDPDDDNDGVLDITKGPGDSDGDGIPDAYDLDSDNDGIPDVIESGGSDPDGDGVIGTGPIVDTDGDGLSDLVDADNGGTPLAVIDTDGDGIPNMFDLDSDNDGITDVNEAGGIDVNGDGIIDGYVDTDGDGLSDNVDSNNGGTPLTVPDTDGDGQSDYADLDSDNDGVGDVTEAGGTDANGDGIIDGFVDTDNDGLSDNVDTNNGGTMLPTPDTDGDGVANYLDLDSDNDGISDVSETGNGALDANNDGVIDGTDTDGDGIINVTGIDSNSSFGGTNVSSTPDADGDGVNNYLDLDSDNDGISDVTESGNGALDANNDGVVDGTDTDGDGIINVTGIDNNSTFGGNNLGGNDFDGDGIANQNDLDSDNDGITDVVESGNGSLDANNDGIVDGTDTDGDGMLSSIDNNNTFGGQPTTPVNTDASGNANYLDIDSDNDGIVDNIEAQTTIGYVAPTGNDTDNDGIDDAYDTITGFGGAGTTPVNTDATDAPDYLDLDTDNDGIVDAIEGWDTNGDGTPETTPTGTDADNDGLDDAYDANDALVNPTNGTTPTSYPDVVNAGGDRDWREIADHDGDGIADNNDIDDDNDGILDTEETVADFDNDGIPNWFDLDSDNDGIPDVVEGGSPDVDNDGLVDNFTDANNDGYDDTVAASSGNAGPPVTDHDGDGHPDYLDLDSDNDGISDVIEGGSPDVDNDGMVDNFTDTDNNGYDDVVENGTGNAGPPVPDYDNDGVPDYHDLDSDNDGIPDVVEGGSPDVDGNGTIDNFTDADGDGWDDNVENGNGNAGPPFADTDGDGIPDYHDLDSDNDGIPDVVEGGSPDTNGDGLIDNFTDNDGDGWDDNVESGNGNPGPQVPDTDNDGTPDYLDLDSDGDGIPDTIEGGGADADNDGIIDNFTDNDGDGWDDNTETGNGNAGPPVPDTDNDGTPDYLDLDSDGDGTNDGTNDEFPNQDCDGDGLSNYLDPDPCGLVIPQGFSPNGDNINDFFEIKGISAYPDNKVTIFNRWGNIVYEAAGYDNGAVSWDGTNKGELSTGSGPLPEGTYFYVIDLGDGNAVRSGYVFINRK